MKNKLLYHFFNKDPFHTHMKILKRVSPKTKVLEIGSATGYFSQELLKKGCQVTAVENDKKAVQIARKNKKVKTIYGDVNFINKYFSSSEKFDYIILADVLEHLIDPEQVLIKLKKYLKSNGKLLISLPNIANYAIRLKVLSGNFDYQEYGILDKTHLHFFTKDTSGELLTTAGLKIKHFDVVAGFEVSELYRKTLGRLVFRVLPLRYLEYYLTKIFPNLFALEFIYEAENK